MHSSKRLWHLAFVASCSRYVCHRKKVLRFMLARLVTVTNPSLKLSSPSLLTHLWVHTLSLYRTKTRNFCTFMPANTPALWECSVFNPVQPLNSSSFSCKHPDKSRLDILLQPATTNRVKFADPLQESIWSVAAEDDTSKIAVLAPRHHTFCSLVHDDKSRNSISPHPVQSKQVIAVQPSTLRERRPQRVTSKVCIALQPFASNETSAELLNKCSRCKAVQPVTSMEVMLQLWMHKDLRRWKLAARSSDV